MPRFLFSMLLACFLALLTVAWSVFPAAAAELNDVSRFIYWAEVVDKLGGVAGFWGIMFTFVVIAATIGLVVVRLTMNEKTYGSRTEPSTDAKMCTGFWPTMKWLHGITLFLWLLFGLCYIFAPSKNAMYAIAASQLGEQVVKSDTMKSVASEAGALAKDITDTLRDYIKSNTKTK